MTGGAVLSAVSRSLVAVAGAAMTIAAAHLLGPSGFGAFAVAVTTLAVLTVFTTMGIEHGIVYYVSSGRWAPDSAFRSSQWLALVVGAIGAGVAVLARALFPHAFHGLSIATVAMVAVALPFALSWFYGSYVALATGNYEAYVLPPAIQSALALLLVAALASIDGVPGAVLGFATAHVITAVVRFTPARRHSVRASGQVQSDSRQTRRAIGFGIKGYAANALQSINYRLDLFILNATAAGVAVGHYALAVSITSVMWLLPQALSDVLFPRVSALSLGSGKSDVALLALAEGKVLRHAVIVTLIATLVVAFALLFLVVPIYGTGFSQSISLGLILLPGTALLAIANPIASAIVGRGHPAFMLVAAGIVTPLTIAMYVFLIPSLHASGAALASSVSYALLFALTASLYRRITGINPLRLMMPTMSELHDHRALVRSLSEGLASVRDRRRRRPGSPD